MANQHSSQPAAHIAGEISSASFEEIPHLIERYGDDPHVVVELQSLTPDLYHYLKSTMLYRTLDMDSYTEAVQIHSNVSGGWGIVGGLAGDRHVVPF